MADSSIPPPSDRDSARGTWMAGRKRIALIAHDYRKADLLEWVRRNQADLAHHELFATGETGSLIARHLELEVPRFAAGPLGGDMQVGAAIVEGRIDMLVFLWDPLEAQSHDVDVKALLRIAVVCDIPVATNLATADFLVSSPLARHPYRRQALSHPATPHSSPEAFGL